LKLTFLTLFPQMIEPFFNASIMKRAVSESLIDYEIINFRNFASGVHQKTDDYVFGGGAGQLLMPDPLFKALDSLDAKGRNGGKKRVVFPTPSGKLFNQSYAENLSKEDELIFICGHYEGLDQRVIDEYVTDEISIGDYVLSAGETSALVIVDALYRLIDGVISKESLDEESFSNGLLEYPQYTKPRSYCAKDVPSVLLSGHERHITEWRFGKRLEKTLLNRPDLLSRASLSIKERQELLKILVKEDF